MKYLIIILAVSLMYGCQTDTYETDKTDYDLIDYDNGIKVRVEYGDIPTLYTFTSAWTRIQECSGLTYYAPFIVVVKDIEGPADALYFSDGVIVIQRDSLKYGKLIQHEMLHHLLNKNGMSEESSNHTSYLFDLCVPGTTIK